MKLTCGCEGIYINEQLRNVKPCAEHQAKHWTASKGGEVIATADTSAELIRSLRAMGENGRGAIVERHA